MLKRLLFLTDGHTTMNLSVTILQKVYIRTESTASITPGIPTLLRFFSGVQATVIEINSKNNVKKSIKTQLHLVLSEVY